MVLGWIAIVLAVLGLGFCYFLYIEVRKRVLETQVLPMLERSAELLSKDFGRQFRSIEVEWDDMYQKFSRLAGRMDREKRPLNVAEPPEQPAPPIVTRHELLKKWRANK